MTRLGQNIAIDIKYSEVDKSPLISGLWLVFESDIYETAQSMCVCVCVCVYEGVSCFKWSTQL